MTVDHKAIVKEDLTEEDVNYYSDYGLEEVGPHGLPKSIQEKFKEEGYEIRFKTDDPKSAYKLEMDLRKGWIPILKSEIAHQQDMLEKYGMRPTTVGSVDTNYVCSIGKDGVRSILCKMRVQRYNELLKMGDKKVDQSEEQMKSKLKVGGDEQSGFSTPIFQNNHIFKR